MHKYFVNKQCIYNIYLLNKDDSLLYYLFIYFLHIYLITIQKDKSCFKY